MKVVEKVKEQGQTATNKVGLSGIVSVLMICYSTH